MTLFSVQKKKKRKYMCVLKSQVASYFKDKIHQIGRAVGRVGLQESSLYWDVDLRERRVEAEHCPGK